ncbi:MAG: hypothetical protein MUO31_13020 [Thermodesulfovibrionales bacterium]|nr:hypothetical protein [Thermodesulfovibrionales bacterium]
MSNEIRTGFTSGNTLTAVIRRKSDFFVWYPAANVWEAFGTGARTNADYDIALVDKGGDWYVGDFDADITDPLMYDVILLIGGVFAGIQGLEWNGSSREENTKQLATGRGYIGDFKVNDTLSFTWESGMITASGGSIRVYKDGNTSEVTVPTGVTETLDFDSITGKHKVEIDLSANTFYSKKSDYTVIRKDVVIFGQTLDLVIAEFSIEHRTRRGFVPGG